jgi:hypothetical protein
VARDLIVSAVIESPTGPIELEDLVGGYTLAKDSFSTKAASFRKQEVSSIYVRGVFPVRAAPDNIVETVTVDVTGETQAELYERVKALTDALEQLRFAMTVTFGNHREVWSCFISQYTLQEEQEWRVALTSQVRAQINRLPQVLASVV